MTLWPLRNATKWQNLSNRECIKAYGQPFVSGHGSLLAISKDFNATEPVVIIDSTMDRSLNSQPSFEWICATAKRSSETCDIDRVMFKASTWTLACSGRDLYDSADQPKLAIDYCHSEPKEEHCRLQFSLAIMYIVIGYNFAKAMCMLLTLRYHKSQPLVTLGDAVASFLNQPDPLTENMCLADIFSFAWSKNTFPSSTDNAHSNDELGEKAMDQHAKAQDGVYTSARLTTLGEERFQQKLDMRA